jgi:hypothetical protein
MATPRREQRRKLKRSSAVAQTLDGRAAHEKLARLDAITRAHQNGGGR